MNGQYLYSRQKTERRRDTSLLSNKRPTKRPRPNKRPLRPGHSPQVTISPDAAAQIIQGHENLAPPTGEPVPIENGQNLLIPQQQAPVIAPTQQPTRFISGLRPQLPLFIQSFFPNYVQTPSIQQSPILPVANDRFYSPIISDISQTPILQPLPNPYFRQLRPSIPEVPQFELNPYSKEALWHKDFVEQQQNGIPLPQVIQNIPHEYIDSTIL